jgi:hypothetical protein
MTAPRNLFRRPTSDVLGKKPPTQNTYKHALEQSICLQSRQHGAFFLSVHVLLSFSRHPKHYMFSFLPEVRENSRVKLARRDAAANVHCQWPRFAAGERANRRRRHGALVAP